LLKSIEQKSFLLPIAKGEGRGEDSCDVKKLSSARQRLGPQIHKKKLKKRNGIGNGRTLLIRRAGKGRKGQSKPGRGYLTQWPTEIETPTPPDIILASSEKDQTRSRRGRQFFLGKMKRMEKKLTLEKKVDSESKTTMTKGAGTGVLPLGKLIGGVETKRSRGSYPEGFPDFWKKKSIV